MTPPESEESSTQEPAQFESKSSFIEAKLEALIKRRILNPVDPVELAKSWDAIHLRHLHRDRRWEVLQKFMPGYLNARIQRRRGSQQGYRPWIYDLWKNQASGTGFDECKIQKTWQEILEEIDAEENIEDANEKAQAIGSTLCTTETLEKQ